jgi:DNA-binding winged helix-turn-helix (wHTH) protein
MKDQATEIFEFGPFLLDAAQRLLMRHDKPVPLTPKAFETLLALVQNSGRILEKEELLKLVWPDAFVEQATLSQNIFTLRKALGLTEDGRQYIDTIPRRGYRFAADVTKQSKDSTVKAGESNMVTRLLSQEVKAINEDRGPRNGPPNPPHPEK